MKWTMTALILLIVAVPVRAQWRIGLEVSEEHFGSGADGVRNGNHAQIFPDNASLVGVRVQRGSEVRLSIGLGYATPGLAVQIEDLLVVKRGGMQVFSFSPRISLPLARWSNGLRVRYDLGPMVEHWTIPDQSSYWRASGEIGLAVELPIGSKLLATLRGGLAVTPASVFQESDLTDALTKHWTWRRTLAGGLSLKL